jgi:AAA15 family ATPase/GTPase
MLSKIKIKNFKSIETLMVDFSYAEGKAPNGYKKSDILSFLEPTSNSKDRMISVMNLYGANASGKSNIIEILYYIKKIIISGIYSNSFYKPNKLKNLENETYLEIDFFVGKSNYKYILAYNDKTITKEILSLKGRTLFSIKSINANFEGVKNKLISNKYLQALFKTGCLNENNEQQINTFLSFIVKRLPSSNKNLVSAFNFLTTNLIVLRGNQMPNSFAIDYLAKSNKKEDIQESFKEISNLIKNLDIDIEKFKYEREEFDLNNFKLQKNIEYKIDHKNKKISQNDIKTYHKNEKGADIEFEFTEESLGTRLAFGVGGIILKVLKEGGILMIDELDKSLHPLLLKTLIRMFKDKNHNKNKAQLISTLHCTDILEEDVYKISEFAFVNKDKKNGTFIKRLSDFEDVRNDMNFRDRYLDGLYLGIPYPYN